MSALLGSLLFVLVCLCAAGLGGLTLLAFDRLVQPYWGPRLPLGWLNSKFLLPAIVLLFIPLALAAPDIYPWAGHGVGDSFRGFYLNRTGFLLRALVYFVIWFGLAARLRSSRPGGGALALVLILFSGTFAAFDWIMSLEPEWHSTAFGLVFLVGGILLAFALNLLRLKEALDEKTMVDLNNIHLSLFGSWSYVVFMQFLTVWSSDLPHESAWYEHRFHGAWGALALGIVLFQFVLPLPLFFVRRLKRSLRFTQGVALVSVLCQSLYLFWMVLPAVHPERFLTFSDALALLALGALLIYLQRSAPRPLQGRPV